MYLLSKTFKNHIEGFFSEFKATYLLRRKREFLILIGKFEPKSKNYFLLTAKETGLFLPLAKLPESQLDSILEYAKSFFQEES